MTDSALMIGGLVWLTRLSDGSGYVDALLGPMLLMGLGGGLGLAPVKVITMSTVPPANPGSARGVLQTPRQIGGTVGLAILATVFGSTVRHGTGSPAHVLVSGMTSAFVASVALAAGTFVVATMFRDNRGHQRVTR